MAMFFLKKVRLSVILSNQYTIARKFSALLSTTSDKGDSKGVTVDNDEVQKHSKHAKIWWDELGEMKGLHALNKLRVQLVRDGLINTGKVDAKFIDTPQPLCGLKVLEVGCGGGIMTEPMARIGADVTGVDASEHLIAVAQAHAQLDPNISINYVNDTIEHHSEMNKECYDAVVLSEVLEHVTQKDLFLSSCVATIKPGGSIFITTENKTLMSWAGAIVAAEYILNLLPRGTHQWEKFISPEDTKRLLEKHNCSTVLVHGMMYNFLTNQWSWTSFTAINYALQAVKAPKQICR